VAENDFAPFVPATLVDLRWRVQSLERMRSVYGAEDWKGTGYFGCFCNERPTFSLEIRKRECFMLLLSRVSGHDFGKQSAKAT